MEDTPDRGPEGGGPPIRIAGHDEVRTFRGRRLRATAGTAQSAASTSAIVRALRPRQWAKNLLVVAAPGAAGLLTHAGILTRTGLAFLCFCSVASATYLVNDAIDAETDRRHPVKRSRPIASGSVRRDVAFAVAAGLGTAGIGIGLWLGSRFELILCSYVIVTVAYTLWLKRVEVFDIAAVASCYVLRALAGGASTGVSISPWFLVLTSSVALFVAAAKRATDRAALVSVGEERPWGNASDYPPEYLRYVWMLASAIAIAAYCLWAFAEPHLVDGVAWSQVSILPFALGVLRYALVVERGAGGQPEDVLVADRPLELIGVAWLGIYATGVYLR
jgi:decaprenyl-phosphate phosphoribosyltransferase